VLAQDVEKDRENKWSSRLDISYNVGGQLYNDNFIYNPGYSINISRSYAVNNYVGLGIGAGYTHLEYEQFFPLYIEAIGYKKKKGNSPFIKFQFGYSPGAHSPVNSINNYKVDGGIYFNAGSGRRIKMNDKMDLFFHWSYNLQFAVLQYSIFGDNQYSHNVSYDMIQISLGLMLK
jgi:hypothetical protein